MLFTTTSFIMGIGICSIRLSCCALANAIATSSAGHLRDAHLDYLPACIAEFGAALSEAAISSALGMNELQSLNTSDVHAWRCSAVPCEDERAGQAVASSKHRDMHDRTKDLDRRGVHLFWPVVFIQKSRVVNRSRYWTSSRRHRYALAGARACRETSALVAFDPAAAPLATRNGLAKD